MNLFHRRRSQQALNYTYFYTQTIQNFSHLLAEDNYKMIVIESLQYLVIKNLIKLYGYVIMPNHIHLLWSVLKMNGKESSQGSFAKFTAHEFKKQLLQTDSEKLASFASNKSDRSYQFWKRDALAIPMSTEAIFLQRLDYIHNNPVKERWNLCENPEDYRWSSARFYISGDDEFNFLSHYKP